MRRHHGPRAGIANSNSGSLTARTRLNAIPPSSTRPSRPPPGAPWQASAVTIALQLARFAVNLAFTMILSRLLRPEDFGLYGMAYTFLGLLLLFKDGGVESALLRHGPVTPAELASLTSLNVLYGLGLGLLCAALGPGLAWLYDEPRLTAPLLLLGGMFLLHGLDVQPGVQLLREQRFRTHAAIEFAALVLGLSFTLFLARRGAGYWALFATEFGIAVVLLAGRWWATGWRPRFGRSWREVRHFVGFGGHVSLIRALGHAARNVDNLLIGLACGPVVLAFYAKAARLMNMPQEGVNWPLARIAGVTLARTRDDPAAFRRAFRHFNFISAALGLPWAVYFIVSADAVVAVVYGGQWTEVAPLMRWLGLMGLCNTFLGATGWVYLALGTVRRQLRWEVIHLLALGAAFAAGLPWGATGVAIAASAAVAGLRAPALYYCFRDTPLRLRDLGAVLWRPALAAAAGGAAVLAAHAWLAAPGAAWLSALRDAALLAAGYGLGWVAVPGWLAFVRGELHRPEAQP